MKNKILEQLDENYKTQLIKKNEKEKKDKVHLQNQEHVRAENK